MEDARKSVRMPEKEMITKPGIFTETVQVTRTVSSNKIEESLGAVMSRRSITNELQYKYRMAKMAEREEELKLKRLLIENGMAEFLEIRYVKLHGMFRKINR